MIALFDAFAQLDPILQVVAILALVAFVLIVAFQVWRYLQKRRARRRTKDWVAF